MKHATKQAFGQTVNMCDEAREFVRQMATHGWAHEGFTPFWFEKDGVTCPDCVLILKRGIDALPKPQVEKPAPIDCKLGRAIRDDMRRRNPRVADPEWATESYR